MRPKVLARFATEWMFHLQAEMGSGISKSTNTGSFSLLIGSAAGHPLTEGSKEKKIRSKPQPWCHHSLHCAWKAKLLPPAQPQILICQAVPTALSHSCRDPDPAASTWAAPTPPTRCQPAAQGGGAGLAPGPARVSPSRDG